MSHKSHSTLQQGPNTATRYVSGPKSLPRWDEDNCVLLSMIISWNGKIHMSQLDSLSPWWSLLMINKGNFLFSLVCFKCQSSPCVLGAVSLLCLGSVPSYERCTRKWWRVRGIHLCCILAVYPWPGYVTSLSFLCSSVKWGHRCPLWRTVKRMKGKYVCASFLSRCSEQSTQFPIIQTSHL